MLLSELLDQLTQGELSQLKMGGRDSVGIKACDYPKIIPHINLGLTELYKRFNLKNSEVVVQQYDQIQTYYLDISYSETYRDNLNTLAANDPTGNSKTAEETHPGRKYYIMDSVYQPFTGNVLKIEAVHNEQGEELYLNQDRSYFIGSDKYWAVSTPSYNTVQVPYPEKENQMIITYRADHDPIIIGTDGKINDVNIPISPSYLEALLLYIAARVYTNLSSNEGNEGNNYTAKFEASIKQLEQLSLFNKDATQNYKLEINGWV